LIGAEDALRRALQASGGLLDPVAQGGLSAFNLQGAQSGALGPEAQQQAFSNFQASPGQDFLRNRAEQSLLRNQAAIGGLGGGNVRSALQEQAIGLASQDFGNQFDRLGQLSSFGLPALGQQSSQAFQTGQSLAGGRTRAGEQIAGQIGNTSSALANLANQQGGGLSDILGAGGGNLANILSGAGQAQGASQEQLAALLAQISTGGQPGVQQTPSQLGNISNVLDLLRTL
jgi:hypothetical protein